MAESMDSGKFTAMAGVLAEILKFSGKQDVQNQKVAERRKDEAQDQYQGRDGPE